jgi:hypothetical protein
MKYSFPIDLYVTTGIVEFEDEPFIFENQPQAPKGLREAARRRFLRGDPIQQQDSLAGRVEATFDKENR